jgi:hypothetical protein
MALPHFTKWTSADRFFVMHLSFEYLTKNILKMSFECGVSRLLLTSASRCGTQLLLLLQFFNLSIILTAVLKHVPPCNGRLYTYFAFGRDVCRSSCRLVELSIVWVGIWSSCRLFELVFGRVVVWSSWFWSTWLGQVVVWSSCRTFPTSSSVFVGPAGTGDQTRATCLGDSGASPSAIPYNLMYMCFTLPGGRTDGGRP